MNPQLRSLLIFCGFLGLAPVLHAESQSHQDKVIQDIADELHSAPSWRGMDPDRDGPKLVAIMDKTRGLTEKEFQSLIERVLSNDRTDVDQLSKLYILNRFFFNVPDVKTSGKAVKRFGAWWIPENKPECFPLEKKGNGFVIVEGYRGGYMGQPYNALGEMQYFAKTYGTRFHASP